MSSAPLFAFNQFNPTRPESRVPVSIDPLAVASVEPGTLKQCGARVIMDSGTIFDLHDQYGGVVDYINAARSAFSEARRRQP